MPARFPHNSVLGREMRTFREIGKPLFLQVGFAARPQPGLKPAPTLQQPSLHSEKAVKGTRVGNFLLERSFLDLTICLVN
jgi:hypothetical protein